VRSRRSKRRRRRRRRRRRWDIVCGIRVLGGGGFVLPLFGFIPSFGWVVCCTRCSSKQSEKKKEY